MSLFAFHANISGRVQGVGFRYTCFHEARRLGICGWVRNQPNGDVEVWAEGEELQLERFLQWLNCGPPGAWVESVSCDKCQPIKYKSFTIENNFD